MASTGVVSIKGLPLTSGDEHDEEPAALLEDVKLVFSQFGDITRHRQKPNRCMIDLAFEDVADSRSAIQAMTGIAFPPPKNWNLRLSRNWPTCKITVEEGRPITEPPSKGATGSRRAIPAAIQTSRAAASQIERQTSGLSERVIKMDSKGNSPSRYSPPPRERGQKRSSGQGIKLMSRRETEEQEERRGHKARKIVLESHQQRRERAIRIEDTPPLRSNGDEPLPSYLRSKEDVQMDMKALLQFFKITKAEPPLFWKTNED